MNRLDRSTVVILSTAAFSLAPLTVSVGAMLALLGIVAAMLATKARPEPRRAWAYLVDAAVLLLIISIGLTTGILDLPVADPVARLTWFTAAGVQLMGLLVFVKLKRRWIGFATVFVGLAAVAVIGVRVISVASDLDFTSDVMLMHESAWTAVENGENPYEHARAPNSDPTAPEGSVLIGYVYPPITMAPLVAAEAAFGDSRWLLLICWLGLLTIMGHVILRRGPEMLPAFQILALLPSFRILLFIGWTEPLTLFVLALGVAAASASTIGLVAAMAAAAVSKQYVGFLVPLVLTARLREKLQLILATLLAGVATLLPYALASFSSLPKALIGNLAANRVRPDSVSLPTLLSDAGLGDWLLPRPVWLLLVAGWGIVVARRVHDVGGLVVAGAAVLGFAFITSQGFTNYWVLCAGLVSLGSLLNLQDVRSTS